MQFGDDFKGSMADTQQRTSNRDANMHKRQSDDTNGTA